MDFTTFDNKLGFLLISADDFEPQSVERTLNFLGSDVIFDFDVSRWIFSFHNLCGCLYANAFVSMFTFETQLCIVGNVNVFH